MKFYLKYLGYKEWQEVVIEDESQIEWREEFGHLEPYFDGDHLSIADTEDEWFLQRYPHTQHLRKETWDALHEAWERQREKKD